jgi:XTP/dITP diphosphohydrolase
VSERFPRLIVATRNPGKLAEFRRLLAPHPWTVVGLDDTGFDGELLEPGPSYLENATAKAVIVCDATGEPAIADDSGIEVDALRGWPGPQSARWLGEGRSDAERLHALLEEVEKRTPDDRRARYVAVVTLARPGAEPVSGHGETLGRLVEPRGSGGFGYDPAFLSDDLGVTFGEAAAADKDRVSHRARAIARVAEAGVLERVDTFR